jgi:hypothetical protein
MRIRFSPVSIFKHGIMLKDGHMVYTDARSAWLYVSEDGQTAIMYNNISDLIREMYRKNDDDDYVIAGWDMYPARFDSYTDDAYRYYNERFED